MRITRRAYITDRHGRFEMIVNLAMKIIETSNVSSDMRIESHIHTFERVHGKNERIYREVLVFLYNSFHLRSDNAKIAQ